MQKNIFDVLLMKLYITLKYDVNGDLASEGEHQYAEVMIK